MRGEPDAVAFAAICGLLPALRLEMVAAELSRAWRWLMEALPALLASPAFGNEAKAAAALAPLPPELPSPALGLKCWGGRRLATEAGMPPPPPPLPLETTGTTPAGEEAGATVKRAE